MQIQIFRVPGFARRQVISVDMENTGTSSIFAWTLVFTTGCGRGSEGFNRANLKSCLRRNGKEFRNFFIDLNAQCVVSIKQGFFILELELLVGIHEMEKVLQAAFKIGSSHDAAHFAVNTGNFRQADVVQLLGRQIGRGRYFGSIGINSLAVWQALHADSVPAGRQVFIIDEGAQLLDGWIDLSRNHCAVLFGQS